ncbi:MAG: sigma-54 dependent transcriptional regulator [Bacteroidetes bacterium]|nr:sigma-54 dependent transcriptional regulator [Bacteroidota bacterium]
MANIDAVKQKLGIIGSSDQLNRAIDIAIQVAPTDLSVLITGESGTGKESFPQIIHQNSPRKHAEYIALNCGAIPEGTIDSELFGHEKGAFTGAHDARKGYFEVVDKGTIFLDEVGELPLPTQARLLRILESGEYIRVGSSKVQKTNVRVVAATNVDLVKAVQNGKFREDLYYRLNTVPIKIPPLRDRKQDIHLLFRKFVVDFADKYRMPPIKLEEDAVDTLVNYRWPGNIRQLKNIAEQISVIEEKRVISKSTLLKYLPASDGANLPVLISKDQSSSFSGSIDNKEKELLYKVLFDMRKELNDLKKIVFGKVPTSNLFDVDQNLDPMINNIYQEEQQGNNYSAFPVSENNTEIQPSEEVEESLSLSDKEKEFIIKALEKHRNKRKNAAKELGISERTLYRKIKEYDIK